MEADAATDRAARECLAAFLAACAGRRMDAASLVLEQRDGGWRGVPAHFSMPAAGQQDSESF